AVPRPAAAHHEGERSRRRAARGDRGRPDVARDARSDRAGDGPRPGRRRAADHRLRHRRRMPGEGAGVRRVRLHVPHPLSARRRRSVDDRRVRGGGDRVRVAASPRTLPDALAERSAERAAVVVAGGTDLMVSINAGTVHLASLLDVSHVAELDEWYRDDDRVFVGAGVTFSRIVRELGEFGPLAQAARSVGSLQIRNRATLGGNLGTASPAGDGIAALAAYDAEVILASSAGKRRLPCGEFLL